ncbi:hypothetical protein [Metabacillus idriensis]|nr:hypothetical protein [Metabacillus idriensis]
MTKELAIYLLESKDVYLSDEGKKILLEVREEIPLPEMRGK